MTTAAAIPTALTDLADRLADELRPEPDSRTQDGGTAGGQLAVLFADPSRTGSDDRTILAVIVELSRILNLTTTALAAATDAAHRARIPTRKGLRTATDLLKELGHAPALAYRLTRVGRTAPQLPALSRQARTGTLGIEHLDAVGQGIDFVANRIPLDADARTDLARRLTVHTTPADIARRARELALEWAPTNNESADPDQIPVAENTTLNELAITIGADGRTTGTLDLDALTAEELHQALDALTKPVLEPDGSPDPRTTAQRRADGFGQIIRDYLTHRDRPTTAGGVLPHVTLIIPTHAGNAAEPPSKSSDQNQSTVPTLGFTGPISPPTANLILCDAAVRRIALDENSAPLDVGREHRLVTLAIRKALEARDRGCAHPGCGRPVAWTDAHHITPWSEGGTTSLDNCVLLCRMHHTMIHHTGIHHTGWQIVIGHDRHPWFIPPTDPDHPNRTRQPLRSNARRTLTNEATAAA